MRKIALLIFLVLLLSLSTALAQTDTLPPPEPERVEISAADGLALVGDFYSVPDSLAESPTVLLLHMLNNTRSAWNTLIPALLAGGYNALAVDLRGHGETGGRQDWDIALHDTQLWLDWLREQATVKDDSLSIMGASIGTPLALAGCAADEACVTAILLSPVLLQMGLKEAVSEKLTERSVLLIASQEDRASANGVRWLVAAATGEVGVHLFHGSTHGTNYLNPGSTESVTTIILDWLDAHLPPTET